MSSRWTGFFVWALVAASAAFWSLKIFAAPRPVPDGAQAPSVATSNGPMERLFGAVVVASTASAAPPPESSRFKLSGVIASPNGASGGGFAVVQIDDSPARTWRVGATLDGSTTLLAVSKRGAEFGPAGGPASFSLQLPEPAAAETGSLPAAVSQADPAQAQAQVQMLQQQPQQQPPQMPGRAGAQGRPMGRGGYVGPQGGAAPSRVGTPPDQTIEAPALQQ